MRSWILSLIIPVLLPGSAALHSAAVAPCRTACARASVSPVMVLGKFNVGPKEGERKAAVERILNVELARLITAVNLNLAVLSPRESEGARRRSCSSARPAPRRLRPRWRRARP